MTPHTTSQSNLSSFTTRSGQRQRFVRTAIALALTAWLAGCGDENDYEQVVLSGQPGPTVAQDAGAE